jgi:hypothetical protein
MRIFLSNLVVHSTRVFWRPGYVLWLEKEKKEENSDEAEGMNVCGALLRRRNIYNPFIRAYQRENHISDAGEMWIGQTKQTARHRA